jgi:hypothetical protein
MMPRNPIRWAAVVCVAVTSVYIMWMSTKFLAILSSPEWCGKALQAEKISSQNFGGLTACTDLLKIQLNAIARGFLINNGTVALCLLTLIVLVIAAGKLDLKANKDGIDLGLSREEQVKKAAVAGAQAATDSAQETTEQLKEPTP